MRKIIITSAILGLFLVYSAVSLVVVLTIPERLKLYTYPPNSVCVPDISYGFAMSSVIMNFSLSVIATVFFYSLKYRQNVEIEE